MKLNAKVPSNIYVVFINLRSVNKFTHLNRLCLKLLKMLDITLRTMFIENENKTYKT